MKVLMVEPVGGHRGMHYYDFGLCAALSDLDVHPTLVTSDETEGHTPPVPLDIRFLFREIYGERNVARRAANYVYALFQTARLAREGGYGIVHCHYFLIPPADYLFLLGLKAAGVKVVITAHDVTPFDAKSYTHFALPRIYGLADKIIVHAEDNKRRMCDQFGTPPRKVDVIHHGNYMPYVEDDGRPRQLLREEIGVKGFDNVVLFFGQIKKVKGLDHLIRAFPAVLDRHPSTALVVAGQAWKDDFSSYARLVSALGLQGNFVSRIEHIPDEDVAAYFRSADVVALPYTEVYQSGVLLMACSYGRPVVATAAGGMKEVVQDRVTGYLVPPGDEARLAEAISSLLSDKQKAGEMGRRARQMTQELYSWERAAQGTKQTYSDALRLSAGSTLPDA